MSGERALACTKGGWWPCTSLWVVFLGPSWRPAILLSEGKCPVHPHGTESWSLCEKNLYGDTSPVLTGREGCFFSGNTRSPNLHPVQQQNRMATVSSLSWSKQRALRPQQMSSNSAFKWTGPGSFVNPDSPGLTFGGMIRYPGSRYLNHLPLAFTRIWHRVPLGM